LPPTKVPTVDVQDVSVHGSSVDSASSSSHATTYHEPYRPSDGDGASTLCVVCMDRQRQIVLLPCGHLVLCQVCSEALFGKDGKNSAAKTCPICRGYVSYAMRVLLS
jgi:hypothetical protein